MLEPGFTVPRRLAAFVAVAVGVALVAVVAVRARRDIVDAREAARRSPVANHHRLSVGARRTEPTMATRADDGSVWAAHTISNIPRSMDEVAAAHAESPLRCTLVPPGPVPTVEDFNGRVWYDPPSAADEKGVDLLHAFSQHGVLSFGLEMSAADRAQLPLLSGSIIAGHVDATYVNLMVRWQRREGGSTPYLHYAPVATVGLYARPDRAGERQPLLDQAVDNLRPLGMWVKRGETASAESLRTLVAVNRCTVSKPNDGAEPSILPYYDLLFVRAREQQGSVALYAFATKDELNVLCLLSAYAPPRSAAECSIASAVYFTEYSHAGQYPTAQASRSVRYNSAAEVPVTELHAYAASQNWDGDAWDNLTATLDAIIDGRVPGVAAPAQ